MLFSSTSSATLSLSLSTFLRWRLICIRTCVFLILQNITSIWCVEIWFEFNFQLFEGLDDITWLTQTNNLLVQYLPRASRNNSILSIFLNVELWILDEMSQVTLNSSVNFVIYCIFGDKFKRFWRPILGQILSPSRTTLNSFLIFPFLDCSSPTESSPTFSSQCWVSHHSRWNSKKVV